MSDTDYSNCSCKVGRGIDEYRLRHLDEDLTRLREDDNTSLRELADFVNTRVLERALVDAGAEVAGDAGAVYEALTGEDISAGRRTETRRRLENATVPVSEVESDFVSHQTVRDHLRDCLGLETGRNPTTDTDEAAKLIEWARGRDERIIDHTLARLRDAGTLDVGSIDVTHSVRVICGDCGTSYRVDELLERGECDCDL